jgi:hypothetical protein
MMAAGLQWRETTGVGEVIRAVGGYDSNYVGAEVSFAW